MGTESLEGQKSANREEQNKIHASRDKRSGSNEWSAMVVPQADPRITAQRIVNSQPVRPADLLRLQRLTGNQAVQRLLARRTEKLGPRNANGVAEGAEVVVERAAASAGEPLPGIVRSRFEDATGNDLSAVRVHTGSESAEAARAVGARAYTVGQDIHFGAGEFAPGDPGGVHLLAHEVAHTLQQRGGAPAQREKLEVSTPGDQAEVEADRAADAIVAGSASNVSDAPGAIHRDAAPPTPQTTDPQPQPAPAPAPTSGTVPAPAQTTTPTTPTTPATPATPASTTADDQVNATWKVNWDRKQTGAAVTGTSNARTGKDAASGTMNVSPAGVDSAGKAIPPKSFPWVNAASSGAAVEVGSMTHPKDKAGKVSSGIAYGKPPSATATITVTASADAKKKDKPTELQVSAQKKQVTAAVSDKLKDDLETMGDLAAIAVDLQQTAKTALGQAPTGYTYDAKVVVKQLMDPADGHPKTTDAISYTPFAADGVRIVTIAVPTEAQKLKGNAAVEASKKDAVNTGKQEYHADSTTTKLTTELTTQFKSAFAGAVTNIKKKESTSSGEVSGHLGGSWDGGAAAGLSFKGLTIDIGKLAALPLIEDPPLAWAVSKIFGTATLDGQAQGSLRCEC